MWDGVGGEQGACGVAGARCAFGWAWGWGRPCWVIGCKLVWTGGRLLGDRGGGHTAGAV